MKLKVIVVMCVVFIISAGCVFYAVSNSTRNEDTIGRVELLYMGKIYKP